MAHMYDVWSSGGLMCFDIVMSECGYSTKSCKKYEPFHIRINFQKSSLLLWPCACEYRLGILTNYYNHFYDAENYKQSVMCMFEIAISKNTDKYVEKLSTLFQLFMLGVAKKI